VRSHHTAKRAFGPEDMILAYDILKPARAQPVSQWADKV
jgi:hypothetical protein